MAKTLYFLMRKKETKTEILSFTFIFSDHVTNKSNKFSQKITLMSSPKIESPEAVSLTPGPVSTVETAPTATEATKSETVTSSKCICRVASQIN
jgi:hypothetical protein